MSIEKRRVIDIDDIQRRLTLELVASYYGFTLPEAMKQAGEARMRCPCTDCSGNSDNQSVSINLSDPMKRWKCHREGYGCGAQGRLVMLAYCMKHGRMPDGGKLVGKEFIDIAKDLEALAEGKPREDSPPPAAENTVANEVAQTSSDVQEVLEKPTNVPLSQSENENARKLVKLDEQLTTDLADLSPAASRYARRRPFLLSEQVAQECRTGYMRGNAKSSLRHNWVYGISNRQGEPLAWVGRNVKYEEDHDKWLENGHQGRGPNKYRFPNQSLFRRSLELYGQEWLDDPRFKASLEQYGLILVEGFTDRIRLHELGIMSVAMMSNTLTDEQTELLTQYAKDFGHNRVGIMHDADQKGDEGAKETLWQMHQANVDAYLVWSRKTHDGKFADRQPESLSEQEWCDITRNLHQNRAG